MLHIPLHGVAESTLSLCNHASALFNRKLKYCEEKRPTIFVTAKETTRLEFAIYITRISSMMNELVSNSDVGIKKREDRVEFFIF